jgi:nitrous-oxide reductase
MFREIPVFSADPESGWGYSEETKPMLETSFGYEPWDDQHHLSLSQTKGEHDGRWIFANANNTPRVARISTETFRTEEILEIPNSSGNHSSPFITENSEYIVAGTLSPIRSMTRAPSRCADPTPTRRTSRARFSMISVAPDTGRMKVAFQVLLPGITSTSPAPARASHTAGCSSPAITANSPTPCSK